MKQVFLEGFSLLAENKQAAAVIIGVLCFGYLPNFFSRKKTREEVFFFLGVGFFFAFSVIMRLAYLNDLLVPPYFDSPTHYKIIKELTHGFARVRDLTSGYYHLGYHLILSLLTRGLRADLITLMLVFGQLTLAALPLPVLFILYRETESKTAAFLGATIAAFGWYMPAFSVNWGKYPALAGIYAFEVVLLALSGSKRKKTSLWAGIAVTAAAFIHTRSLVLFACVYLARLIADKAADRALKRKQALFIAFLGGIVFLVVKIVHLPLLKPSLEPYLGKSFLGILLLVLLPLAWYLFPRQSLTLLGFIFFALLALFIPVDWILSVFPHQTLLDRPFLEMILFFPLSLLAGMEIAGLENILTEKLPSTPFFQKGSRIFAVFTLILLGREMIQKNDFSPSACCRFFYDSDSVAFDWIENNLPPKSTMLIAAEPLKVLPSAFEPDLVGTDAGIWISALLPARTVSMPYQSDFSSEGIHRKICLEKIAYIYLGGTEKVFRRETLLQRDEWYREILNLPQAHIFRVENCPKNAN